MRYLSSSEASEVMERIDTSLDEHLIADLFGADETGNPPYSSCDFFDLPENKLCDNLEGHTTIGSYIYNSFVIKPLHDSYPEYFGYMNDGLDAKTKEKFEAELCKYVERNIITPSDMLSCLDRTMKLGGVRQMSLLSPTISRDMVSPFPGMEELKEELFQKYEKELKENPAMTGAMIEDVLVAKAKEYLLTNPSTKDSFLSGAKINIDNNYKQMAIMMGPVKHSGSGEFNVLKSNFYTGISKEEYALAADTSVQGSFARAESTAIGGYISAKLVRTLSDVYALEDGSDCGTNITLPTLIYPELTEEYIGQNIDEGGKIVTLTSENISKYVMKTVNLYSPQFCWSPAPTFCSKCVGRRPYETGMTVYGPLIYRISSTILNMQLKKFHNTKVKIYSIEPEECMRML